MEATKQTIFVAEALKHLHIASQHINDAKTMQLGDPAAAHEWFMSEWTPKADALENLLLQELGNIVNENAITAAAENATDWAL